MDDTALSDAPLLDRSRRLDVRRKEWTEMERMRMYPLL